MELILNTTVSILLCLTIIYCWRLNNKIQELQNGREKLVNFVKSLDSSLHNANTSILGLKNITSKTITEMSDYIKQSEELYEDLSFLVERAKNLSNQLEENINKALKVSKKSTTTKTLSKVKGVKKGNSSIKNYKKPIVKNA